MLLDCDLIIFDCDGVLVDTEPLTTRLVAEVVTEAGWAIDQAYAVEHFKGRPLTYLCERVGERIGRSRRRAGRPRGPLTRMYAENW